MRNSEVLSQAPDVQGATDEFRAVFAGKKLTSKEQEAVGILCGPDFNGLSIEQRMAIFGYGEFHALGLGPNFLIKKKELFGEVREDERDRIIDRLIYDPFLSEKYEEFLNNLNPRRNTGIQMLKLINKGFTPGEALEKLDIQFDEIKGRNPHERFAEFCSRVELLEHPALSDKEIAQALGSTTSRVKRARKRLRDEGLARRRTPKEVSRVRTRERALLRRRIKNYGIEVPRSRIAQQEGITVHQVKTQRRILYRRGELKKHLRSDSKEWLRGILDSFGKEHPLERINLSSVAREGNLGVSFDTVQSLYHEIKREQEVPPIRKIRKSPATRSEAKERLRAVLNSFMEQNPSVMINLFVVFRDGDIGVSRSTVQSLYHEIAGEQQVPPIRQSSNRIK